MYHLICGLSANKATGCDGISCKILKLAAPVISETLTYIFNQCITLSVFPDEWKTARIIPLYKNGHRNLPGNYRPISILPVVSKIIERILYDQLYNYFSKSEILSDCQFGFRKSHSTTTALIDCTNDWYTNMDKRLLNLVVQIDLKKAFDTVDHKILLRKLELYGIKGQAYNLIESYLSKRTQRCQIKNFISSQQLLSCGVPQGSILGPLFFLIYINDLPSCLEQCKPKMFADDTSITASNNDIVELEKTVNSDLNNLEKWLIANKLSLNSTKTEYLIIGSKQMIKNVFTSNLHIAIGNYVINRIYEYESLGLIIDQHLSCKSNTDKICKKVAAGISALRKLKEYTDKQTLISIYNALVHPYFTYCCEVWGVLGETQSKRLQKLQNRAAKIIISMGNDVDHCNALQELKWEPLEILRKKAKAKLMFKLLKNAGPNSLTRLFTYKKDITDYNLRNITSCLNVPMPSTNSLKKSFAYDGASVWNSIPAEIRNSKSVSLFQKKIAACIL